MNAVYLGEGKEGVVWRLADYVIKRFRPRAMSDAQADALRPLLPHLGPAFPVGASLRKQGNAWEIYYPWFSSEAVEALSADETKRFLARCITAGVVADNFKLANLRRANGDLVYIDLGKQVGRIRQTVFRDTAAKAYALLTGIMTEVQLITSFAEFRRDGNVERMHGFGEFYADVVRMAAEQYWESCPPLVRHGHTTAPMVSLMIKCCAMDAAVVERQASHIVNQLSSPRRFFEVVLAIDPKQGLYLRQHAAGDLTALRLSADKLKQAGVVDRVIESPGDVPIIRSLYERWFGLECENTHAVSGVPVFPQLWAFEQLATRYVLQADLDVLIGRLDFGHDYLAEMLVAIEPEDVMGVGFNIPHSVDKLVEPYDAPVGQYKPEVRLGLFDLQRLRSSLPWVNSLRDGSLVLGWYQSLHRELGSRRMRCVRGGDARTFYVHPMNTAKTTPMLIESSRSLIESGVVPAVQEMKWDLVESQVAWEPAPRHESVVFLIMGANIPLAKVVRCLKSLLGQTDQGFGVIFVDDGSSPLHASNIAVMTRALGARLSFISHDVNRGRLYNKWTYIRSVVRRDHAFIIVLDMDDALMSPDVVSSVKLARSHGQDVLVGGMYRPEKPLKLYPVRFTEASANRGAGNVWNHLRCFTKAAFMTLDESDLKHSGCWINIVSDYATMIPIVSRTSKHAELDGFLCWHERSTPPTPEKRAQDDKVIDLLLVRNKRQT